MARIVERDDAAVSATTTRVQEKNPVVLSGKACAEYLDALGVASESVLGAERLAQIDQQADAVMPGITDYPAWPALRGQLQRVALNGADPIGVLREEKIFIRPDHAVDPAAVLASRIEARDRDTGPAPWLPPVPRELATDEFWGRYFTRRTELISQHAVAVRATAGAWTPQTTPGWAVPIASDPELARDLALWRAAHAVPDTDLRPTGPATHGVKNHYQQQRLDRRATEAGVMPGKADARIAQLGEKIQLGITSDPAWPSLAQQLWRADALGIDQAEMRRIATAHPLPIEQPAAALTYRLIDAIGDCQPPPPATEPGPLRRYEPMPLPTPPSGYTVSSHPTDRRTPEPMPRPTPPPAPRIAPAPQPGPRR